MHSLAVRLAAVARDMSAGIIAQPDSGIKGIACIGHGQEGSTKRDCDRATTGPPLTITQHGARAADRCRHDRDACVGCYEKGPHPEGL
jgi:hypothetical protein